VTWAWGLGILLDWKHIQSLLFKTTQYLFSHLLETSFPSFFAKLPSDECEFNEKFSVCVTQIDQTLLEEVLDIRQSGIKTRNKAELSP
jgi:hypothetical protein